MLEPLPHQLHPNDWPQPDYFTEALKLTSFQPDKRFKALKLTRGLSLELLVLPVQMQAFGWTPAFTALVGARLDQALAARGLNANRQTDLFDSDGPYVRRFDEAQITAFASEHSHAPVLALYLGRDAAGKDFVTLTLRRATELTRAHRSVDERPDPISALTAIGSQLPAMLSELGLVGNPMRPEPERRCDASDWDLEDLTLQSPRGTRACRALVLGTLLPEFERPTVYYPRPKTAAKLAWLAEAYVEADALSPATATAVRTIAWSQFDLTDAYASVGGAIDVDDPVAQPLARLLWARERTMNMPVSSRADSVQAYAAAAANGLPPLALAAFTERANYEEQFWRVDICALELLVPAMRVPVECAERQPAAPLRKRLATRAESALLDEWRLARSFKDLRIQGRERGDPVARQRVLDALPSRVAAHPFLRQERFATEDFDRATGEYGALVKRALAAATDFVQTTADLQRGGTLLSSNTVVYGPWTKNTVLRAEAPISLVARDEFRMSVTLQLDGFSMRGFPLRIISGETYHGFLRPGPMVPVYLSTAMPSGPSPVQPPVAWQGSAGRDQAAMHRPAGELSLFMGETPGGDGSSISALEQRLASAQDEMEPRVELALARMKAGQSLAQGRALIDERPVDRRADYRINETHEWAIPAHALFYAAELDPARQYYQRVADIGTGSNSDLHARVRLRLIAGDIPGALKATRERLERYGKDFARRDLAGLEFMLGHADAAWAVLRPRLPQSGELELWVGAEVGHRIQGLTSRQVRDWIATSDYGHAKADGVDIGAAYLNRFMLVDRLPTDDDLALMEELGRLPSYSETPLEAGVRLKRLALAPQVDAGSLQVVRELTARVRWDRRATLKPFYAWVAWQASAGKDPSLAILRSASLGADFDSLIAKGLLLGLEGDSGQAMVYLRAARIELAELSSDRLREEFRAAPYTAALASYLLYRKTKAGVYREEALRLAYAYQRIFPFQAWPYALDALLSPDGPVRSVAACRAQFLDRESLFLKLSGLKPVAGSDACRKALW
jgi:hypothetical protein